jgi:SprT protein
MPMKREKIEAILQEHITASAVPYCFALWQQSPFELKLTKRRQTKVGDFTSRKSALHPRITLNHDLNPHTFLITYIHEVAHHYVHKMHGHKVDPHGEEWKNAFKELMRPMLQETTFPPEILHELRRHMANPKASSFADTDLTKVLRQYDKGFEQLVVLSEIPEGSLFSIRGRFFKKGILKRTRYLCRELKSKRQYLVPSDAEVSNVQLSLL